jgi:group I intron endonuclease
MGYIYLIRNKINNLCYIGQTRQNDVNLRWLEHKSNLDKKRGCPLLKEAFKKYGFDNFVFKLLIICFDKDLNKFEIEYIKKYNTKTPYGYNVLDGGYNFPDNRKEVHQYDLEGNYIRTFNSGVEASIITKIHKQGISDCLNNRAKSAGGYQWSREKLYKINIYEKEDRKNIIYCYDLQGNYIREYNGLKEASELTKVNAKIISMSCLCYEKRKKGGIYQFRYEKNDKIEPYIRTKVGAKKVYKYSKEGKFIEEYLSLTEASKKNNINRDTISLYCKNKKEIKGFIWKFNKD